MSLKARLLSGAAPPVAPKVRLVPPVVRASDAHLYPAWWPKMPKSDWLRTVQEARTATFVPDLGLLADSSLARTGGANGWRGIGIGAVHWCFDLRGDAPAWVKANVEALRAETLGEEKGEQDENR